MKMSLSAQRVHKDVSDRYQSQRIKGEHKINGFLNREYRLNTQVLKGTRNSVESTGMEMKNLLETLLCRFELKGEKVSWA